MKTILKINIVFNTICDLFKLSSFTPHACKQFLVICLWCYFLIRASLCTCSEESMEQAELMPAARSSNKKPNTSAIHSVSPTLHQLIQTKSTKTSAQLQRKKVGYDPGDVSSV